MGKTSAFFSRAGELGQRTCPGELVTDSPPWAEASRGLLRCPIRLHLQNTHSKLKFNNQIHYMKGIKTQMSGLLSTGPWASVLVASP